VLRRYGPALFWVRRPNEGIPANTLTLGFCEKHAWSSGWKGNCIDAGTGELIVQDSAAD
jgi:hypothetical protein